MNHQLSEFESDMFRSEKERGVRFETPTDIYSLAALLQAEAEYTYGQVPKSDEKGIIPYYKLAGRPRLKN